MNKEPINITSTNSRLLAEKELKESIIKCIEGISDINILVKINTMVHFWYEFLKGANHE